MRRIVFSLGYPCGLISIIFLSGCVPYGYPSFSRTPSVTINAPPSDVHAFRVDIDNFSFVGLDPAAEQLTELRPAGDQVNSQFQASTSWGLLSFPFGAMFHHSKSLGLRLYRPGYETVDYKSWAMGGKAEWKPARDLAAQERALDDLLQGGTTLTDTMTPAQKNAYLYIASEYERFAAMSGPADQQARLAEKATKFRDLAKGEVKKKESTEQIAAAQSADSNKPAASTTATDVARSQPRPVQQTGASTNR